jgi:hypothetical protein
MKTHESQKVWKANIFADTHVIDSRKMLRIAAFVQSAMVPFCTQTALD